MAFNDYRDLIRQMEREMQQLSDEAFRGFFAPPTGGRFWQPPVDINETAEAVSIKVELAGVRADDLQVSLTPDDRTLNISGARAEGSGDRAGRVRCHHMEIYFGPFERAVTLPGGIRVDRDSIKASYRDGFLLVTLPKVLTPEQPQTRVIRINADGNGAESNGAQTTEQPTENEDNS